MDLSILNEQQQEAVTSTEGAIMVMAGAGSGKTRVLTYRLAYLVSELGINPSNILAVTFTNKAAKEMKERISKLIDEDMSRMWVSTFHSFCARFLRIEIKALGIYRNDFIIIDDDDALKIIREEMKDKDCVMKPKDLLNLISIAKNEETLPELDHFERNEFDLIYKLYQEHLLRENLLDFDDLLLLTVKILEENPSILEKYNHKFSYIMIDEFQDTNKIQYRLIQLLSTINKNVFIVGDINQSIYSFRGARISNVSEFKKKYEPKIIKLEQNYRSTQTILKIANNIISKNQSFVNMELFTEGLEGEKAEFFQADSNYGETLYIIKEINKLIKKGYEYKDIAILYRLNSLSLNFENEFVKANIPYVIYGGVGYYERKEVKDIIAYLRLLVNPKDDFSFKRIVNEPKRKIGEKLIANLMKYASSENLSLYEAIPTFGNKLLFDFYKMIEEIREKLDKLKLDDLIDVVLNDTNYLLMLRNNEEEDRIDNVMELKSIMQDVMESYEGNNIEKLQAFLLDLALKTDVDNISEGDNRVKLMSYHQAKGLEYKVVFMVAMEQGIFPSSKSLYSTSESEEERRVCYVGVTRAREKLYLTCAKIRRLYGHDNYSPISEFIRDIDQNHLNQPSHMRSVGHVKQEKIINKPSAGRFQVGDRITHKIFGDGIVVKTDGNNITAAFNREYGIKVLLANHPSITKR